MKKIILILSITLLLYSCGLPPSETEKKQIVEKKIVEQKQVLVTRFKEEALKNLQKFDKNNTREEETSLTGFLCFNDTLSHPATGLSIKAKNCKNERNDKVIFFKVKGNSIYKVVDKDEEELIKIQTSKFEKDTMGTYLNNNVIANFKNILDKQDCRYRKLVKKDFLKNDQSKEIYAIEPVAFYKMESLKQIKINPSTTVCEGFFPNLRMFFVYDPDYPKYTLQVLRKDPLMDFDSLKYN